MSKLLRKGTGRINLHVVRRNHDIHAALAYVRAHPRTYMTSILGHFSWSDAKGRSVISELIEAGAVHVADTEQTSIGSKRFLYEALNITTEEMHERFPLATSNMTLAELDAQFDPTPGPHAINTRPVDSQEPNKVRRDPLVEMLMGSGPAPSLNFIDSMKGVPDVKSQAASTSH